MPQNVFVGDLARNYDALESALGNPAPVDPAVDLLAALAEGDSALEFAIGTGRIALPLSARGVAVQGIEISADMVAELRKKPGGDPASIPVVIGDMTTTRIDGEFALVYLVYNTISNLLDQSEQVDCFSNAARHLRPGGAFVIECFLPQLRRIPPGENVVAFDVSEQHVGFDRYDFVNQQLVSHHYWLRRGEPRTGESRHRYVWPSELDLMARIAGLRLSQRWADWAHSPIGDDSPAHVSVWTKPR